MSNRSILSDLFSLACLVPPLREVSSLHYKYIYVSIYIYTHTHWYSYCFHTLLHEAHSETNTHTNTHPLK